MRAEDRYDSLFQYYGWQQSVDWLLLKAQVKAESNFDPNAQSKVGARGLAQFMARTFEEWRDGSAGIQAPPDVDLVLLDPRDPEDAIRAHAAYMAWLLKQMDGDIREALASYNWGIGNMRRLIQAQGAAWAAHLPEETQSYIARIETNYQRYKKETTSAFKAV